MLIMDERKFDTRNLLSDIGLFEGLAPAQLDWVAKNAHRRVFAAGTNVMTVEQPGEAVFIILHGTVKIHIEQGGRDVILSILGGGDLLGEMSLIDSMGRSASALTLESSLMLWMDKTTFNYLLDNFPPVARNLVKILSARVRLSDQVIQSLATLDVNGRVARQLLAFAERYGREVIDGVQVRIVVTQGDLADLVGASRKRVNQAMVFFKEQELASTDTDGRFIIHNKAGLARFCD
ncbi:Crp/Fnr family transcriptional regulator [Candidatus Villigracilis saccharophilus]|uniref:Crp/Fnr family transcriptional regulator n=1 Tax=Candidatus Villigracilis saccharophilus TaxID=3140684 RepID=UPI0031E74313